MKKLIFVFILAFAVGLFAADTDRYYQGTVTKTETATTVEYKWVVTIGADSSDQLHSPPLRIVDSNNAGFIRAVVSAASDVNVYYHYGYGNNWIATVTATNLDATSSTAKYDPLTTAYSFRCAEWVVLEIDGGGITCNAGEVVTIIATYVKDELFLQNGQPDNVGMVKNSNDSDWVNP